MMARKKAVREEHTARRKRGSGLVRRAGTVCVYTLEVVPLSEPHTRAPAESNARVSRTLQLRGDQTLADLHRAIGEAFGFQEETVYEFQLGKEPFDPDGPRYVLPGAYEVSVDDGTPAAGRVDQTTLDTLVLEVGRRFASWTDDDCGHEVAVVKREHKTPRGIYPKITRRIGDNPPGLTVQGPPVRENAAALENSDAADAACLVGELHLNKRDYRKAVEAFTRALEESPTADAYAGRAQAYRGLAAEDEACARKLR